MSRDRDPPSGLPASRSRRFVKLASMTAQVATGYAGNRVASLFRSQAARDEALQRRHARSGELITRTLGELKGAAMKVGQMASWVNDLVPSEIGASLTALQKSAPPMGFEAIGAQIEAELGSPPELLFQRFDREPFAAASLGQVHRAVVDDGREVVVKIQYPGVDRSVDADLAQLKLALRMAGLVRVPREKIDEAFAEIRSRLHEELDYCNEADNLRRFTTLYGDLPWLVLPEVVGERSAQRILTMTCELGDDLPTVMESYDQPTRDLIGHHLVELLARQLFIGRDWHADPNPANFAFRPDGTVIVYDFGCMKRFEPRLARTFSEILRGCFTRDCARLERAFLEIGLRRPEGPYPGDDFYLGLADAFFGDMLLHRDFHFGRSRVHLRINDYKNELFKRWRSFQPPTQLIFLDRTIAGIYGMLLKLEATVPFVDILEAHMAQADAAEADAAEADAAEADAAEADAAEADAAEADAAEADAAEADAAEADAAETAPADRISSESP